MVRPGERIATDGTVRAGRSSLDTSAITGESIPVEVEPGTDVSAGSINTTGVLEVEATAAGTDNSLTTIVELVEQAQAEKGDRARLADRIARPLVPGVMILAVLVGVLGSLLSGDPELWITRAWWCWSQPRRARWRSPSRSPLFPRSARRRSSVWS